MYLQLLTFAAIVLTGTFIFFQIILPLIRGTPLFPFFSKREEMGGAIETEEEALVVQKEKKKLDKLKEKRQKNSDETKG